MEVEVTRSLPVQLTDGEVADRVREARQISDGIIETSSRIGLLGEQVKRLKEEVAVSQRRESHLVKVADDREELREVACRWTYDLDSNSATLARLDTGEMVESRAITSEERKEPEQRPLFEEQAATAREKQRSRRSEKVDA